MEIGNYYNSTNLTKEELAEAVTKAKSSEAATLLIYLHTRTAWTVSDILKMCERRGHKWIKVSIGRAVSTLLKKKALLKTARTKTGMYGAPECYYIINPEKYPTKTSEQIGLY